jgi:hypothetical protein
MLKYYEEFPQSMKNETFTTCAPESVGLLKFRWLSLFAAALLTPSLFWIALDHRVWPWDQAWYGEQSVDSWYWLTHSIVKWVQPAPALQSFKPPALVWIGQFFVPLRHLFGSVELSLLVSTVLAQFVLLLVILKIGTVMSKESRLIAVTGVLFTAGALQFVRHTHEFFVEPLQAITVAWAFLVALRAHRWSRSRIMLHLAANFAFGLLVKASTPAYCWLPLLYCVFVMLRKRNDIPFSSEWKSRSFRAFFVVTCAGILICLYWYSLHISDVWQHVYAAASGEEALDYGSRDTIVNKLGVWIPIVLSCFFSPLLSWVCLAALGLAAYLVTRRGTDAWKKTLRSQPVTILAILQVAFLLFLFSSNIGVDYRYAYAMLPSLAIVIMAICKILPRTAIIALMLLCGARWAMVNYSSFSGEVFDNQSKALSAPHRDRTEFDELTRVVQLTATPGNLNNMIAVEYHWLNADSARFFAAKERLSSELRSNFISAGYAQKNLDAAMRRMEDFHVSHVITVAKDSTDPFPPYLNIVSRAILDKIEHDNRFTAAAMPSKKKILVFGFHPPQTDLAKIPPEIARAKLVQRGQSSLDTASNAAAKRVNNLRFFSVDKGTIYPCIGWAFDDLLKTTPDMLWLELTQTDNKQRYYWPVQRYDRPELAEALKIPSIKRSGFKCEPVNFVLPAGTYTTKLLQVEGDSAIVNDLNRYDASPTIVVQ